VSSDTKIKTPVIVTADIKNQLLLLLLLLFTIRFKKHKVNVKKTLRVNDKYFTLYNIRIPAGPAEEAEEEKAEKQ